VYDADYRDPGTWLAHFRRNALTCAQPMLGVPAGDERARDEGTTSRTGRLVSGPFDLWNSRTKWRNGSPSPTRAGTSPMGCSPRSVMPGTGAYGCQRPAGCPRPGLAFRLAGRAR
jgi:hypothetical protein